VYLSAVWFLWHEGAVVIATGGKTRKARNATERSRAAVMIDARASGAPLHGAAAEGAVSIVRGEAAMELNELVWAKYLTPEGLAHPEVGGAIRAHDDTTIRLVPDGWRTWGTDVDFGGALELPGIAYRLDE
jgi:hypothetical protein